MSDIDDELLALAGGDVSSDGEEAGDVSREGSRSPLPAPSKKQAASKGTAQRKPPAKKAKKRTRDDDSEEEGEASSPPASPSSQQSAPMDESDSDSDSGSPRGRGDGDANKYPVEGLFISHAEKEEIMAMREIEREQILAERREESELIRQNRMLRQLAMNQDKDKKRKASAAELEDGQRKTSRVRTKVGGTKVGETSSAIDTLRRAREERNSRMQQRERENDRRRQRSPSYRADRDGDGDSDVEWAKGKSRSPEVREIPPAELRDIERVRVGRSRFAEVCFYPGFEDALTGCFVRVNIGPDPDDSSRDVYRMAVIKGFKTGRPYAMPDQRGHQMVVDSYVRVALGKSQREWPFIGCSDRAFTEAEWNRYKIICKTDGINIPKQPALVNKIDDINKLVNHLWTEVELAEKLNRQNALRQQFSSTARDRLVKQIEEARQIGDEARVTKLQEELDRIPVPRLAFSTSLNPSKKKADNAGPSQQERLAVINAVNRRRNNENVRKAQLLEMRRTREAETRGSRETASGNGLATSTQTSNGSGTNTPANGTPQQKPALPHIAKLQAQRSTTKSGIPTIHKPLMDDDIIGALDLDIDIEID
ncbi:plus-3-domain-containing protein [Thozetella sp. PMI_491]|nr:plus-3-domain-containing protein [Thozetella sp. PMI_491]